MALDFFISLRRHNLFSTSQFQSAGAPSPAFAPNSGNKIWRSGEFSPVRGVPPLGGGIIRITGVFVMARGDHLFVPLAMGITHHVIQVDNDNCVGWTKSKSGQKAIIRVHSLEEFHGGAEFKVREYADCFDNETVVAHALSRVGETGYDPKDNNCEHFCCKCKTGRHYSSQVWFVERVVEQAIASGSKTAVAAATNCAAKVLLKKATGSIAVKSMMRTASPWLLVADGAQLATSLGLSHLGVAEGTAETVGKGVGLGGSLLGGAALGSPGGPAGMAFGAAVGGGAWLFGECAAKGINYLVDFFRK
jgi:ketosteroid isomerase-like protein